MTEGNREPTPLPARMTRSPRDGVIRVAAVVTESDDELLTHLRLDGFRIETAVASELNACAKRMPAEVVLVDADVSGALEAVGRLRRAEGVLCTVPVVFIGSAEGVLRSSLDAVESGGDAYVPRPVSPVDLADRVRGLIDLPSIDFSMMGGRDARAAPPIPPSLLPPPLEPVSSSGTGASGSTGLSEELSATLRAAATRVGLGPDELALPAVGDEALDDLIPPELLEPLDVPLDVLGEEAFAGASQNTPPPMPGVRRSGSRPSMPAIGRSSSATPTLAPLLVAGEQRLGGSVGRHGVPLLLASAWRARASGLLVLRARGTEHLLSLTSGHLLALRSSRATDGIGPLLARLGFIPREAARFADVPLDAGVRGAAMLAAKGYLPPEALVSALARVARDVVFDLFALDETEWEMRSLETAAEIPLVPRALDALVILGARARIEPAEAVAALGGRDAALSLRADGPALSSMPLSHSEREAAGTARGTTVAQSLASHGEAVIPVLLALSWLSVLRIENAAPGAWLGPAPVGAQADREDIGHGQLEAPVQIETQAAEI